MTMMGKTCPVRTRAFSLSGDKRARRAAMSPLGTACFDIFSPPPGAREVMTQVERLSSRDTKIALREDRLEICADSSVFVRSRAEGLHGCSCVGGSAPHSAREQDATSRAHGIFGEDRDKHQHGLLPMHRTLGQTLSWLINQK